DEGCAMPTATMELAAGPPHPRPLSHEGRGGRKRRQATGSPSPLVGEGGRKEGEGGRGGQGAEGGRGIGGRAPPTPAPLPRGERGAQEPTSPRLPFSPRGRRCPEGADEGARCRPRSWNWRQGPLTPGPSPTRGEGGENAGKPHAPLLPSWEKVARSDG